MVWFFGGAFNEGGGSMPLSDGDALAEKGVIVVSLTTGSALRLLVASGADRGFAAPRLGQLGLMDLLAR